MTTEPRDPHELDEDGFHEIQLSGKQLVFLCMATTVVSIVIFLCGVLVGRGVRPVEPVAEAAAITSPEPVPPPAEPAPAPAEPAPVSAASNAPASSAANKPIVARSAPEPTPDAPPADEHGTTAAAKPNATAPANRSVISPSSSQAPAAAATPAPVKPEPTPKRAEPPAAPKETTTAAARPAAEPPPVADAPATAPAATPATNTSSGSGAIAVQVGAMKEKGDAEALARHLSGKGYAVYIVQPASNAPNPVYRVRVGNYTSQDEAARVKRRLEQEEKLKPWITR
jgi:cell division septation protein DedD